MKPARRTKATACFSAKEKPGGKNSSRQRKRSAASNTISSNRKAVVTEKSKLRNAAWTISKLCTAPKALPALARVAEESFESADGPAAGFGYNHGAAIQ